MLAIPVNSGRMVRMDLLSNAFPAVRVKK